jgi:S1-C subfamily serine protease
MNWSFFVFRIFMVFVAFVSMAIAEEKKPQEKPAPPFLEMDGQRFWNSSNTSKWIHAHASDLRKEGKLIARKTIVDQLTKDSTAASKINLPTSSTTTDLAIPELVKKISSASVVIMTLDEKGGDAFGTGVAIAPGIILTNWHVMNPKKNHPDIVLMTASGNVLPVAAGIVGNPDTDLAMIRVDDPQGEIVPLPLASSLPGVGEAIWQCGHTHTNYWTVTNGIVNRYCMEPFTPMEKKNSIDMPAMDVSNKISAGSSGSAMVNMRGEIVGIYYARRWYNQSEKSTVKVEEGKNKQLDKTAYIDDRVVLFYRNYCLPVTTVKKLLKP